jgi:hypothetical protein
MLYLKYKFLLIFFIYSFFATAQNSNMSTKDCIFSSYKEIVFSRWGAFDWLSQRLSVDKNGCEIAVSFQRFTPQTFRYNVCKESIYLRVTSFTGEDIHYRKNDLCQTKKKSQFCTFKNDLLNNIKNYGIVFSIGSKFQLEHPHGKLNCLLKITKLYFDKGIVFDEYYSNFLFPYENKKTKLFKNRTQMPKSIKKITISPIKKDEIQIEKNTNIIKISPAPIENSLINEKNKIDIEIDTKDPFDVDSTHKNF